MLAMISDTMEHAVDSILYLRNLASALWQTDGVADLVSDTVRTQALIAVTPEQDEQQARLAAYVNAQLALHKTAIQLQMD